MNPEDKANVWLELDKRKELWYEVDAGWDYNDEEEWEELYEVNKVLDKQS